MSIAQSPFRFLQVPFKKVILQSFIPQEIYLLKIPFLVYLLLLCILFLLQR